ncbi:isochorismatase hydrolase [Isosphaera pallida ATCC 43644]|uniref:nicotinamidase n=1 Tax=Isosphaera pallida (strain ATCC 43644 / DSM 9630 / IS1B) TaxID=575540 RepID=E8R5S1_ISOPI|nr:isochorismatase family protein [Isosphaera pallida]ADV62828.1 isochorismatase hydrolase [Isosphaera pallida ATCC 43644]
MSDVIFVDVDTQVDFLDPNGALYVPGSRELTPILGRLTHLARCRGIPILATACAHTLDELDPEPFPPHCLIGRPGAQRVAATQWDLNDSLARVVEPGGAFPTPPDHVRWWTHLTIQKNRYDVFTQPAADQAVADLRRRFGQPRFVVYGVATDYCVRCAVAGLLQRGVPVEIVIDAVRAVFADHEAEVLSDLIAQGAVLILSDHLFMCFD